MPQYDETASGGAVGGGSGITDPIASGGGVGGGAGLLLVLGGASLSCVSTLTATGARTYQAAASLS